MRYFEAIEVEMKEIREALVEAVGRRIAAHGFQIRRATRSYVRCFAGGKMSFHLALINHPSDFDVVADVAVRFDELEVLINADRPELSKREKGETYSLGAELGNISGGGQKRWSVHSSADVEPVAGQVAAGFEEIGLPYLENASTLNNAYDMLTAPGRAAWLHAPFHVNRAKCIIGLAKILGRTDELPVRLKDTLEVIERLDDPGLPGLRSFASGLGIEL